MIVAPGLPAKSSCRNDEVSDALSGWLMRMVGVNIDLMDATSTETSGTPAERLPVHTEVAHYIGVRPGHCGGRAHILGHRIKVKHVTVWHTRQGLSASEIVELHPTSTLEQVQAALAYYEDHRSEIDAEIAEEDRLYEELKAKQPSILEKIRQRKADAQDDPLSPG
jgi:uncharacterized protein (DUF433 family)